MMEYNSQSVILKASDGITDGELVSPEVIMALLLIVLCLVLRLDHGINNLPLHMHL